MAKIRDYNWLKYKFSKRFYDLRKEKRRADGKKKSFKEMSNEIEELTNNAVSISHTQLAKYYRVSRDEEDMEHINPSLMNVMALADYFNVSLEYMLGISDTRSYSENRKIGSEIFGLTDNSMTILEDLKKQSHIFNVSCFEDNVFKKFSGSDLINYILDNFVYDFQDYFNRYFYEVQRLEQLEELAKPAKINIENIKSTVQDAKKVEKEIIDTKNLINYRKYMITQMVSHFVETLCEKLMDTENEKETD